jgi:hypothetical protein
MRAATPIAERRAQEWTPADLYPLYECARDETDDALAGWAQAAADRRREAFAVYRAAADREDAAALAWMEACAALDAANALGRAA